MIKKLFRAAEILLSMAIFCAAGWIIHRTIHEYGFSRIHSEISSFDRVKLAKALFLAIFWHWFLTTYDFAAFYCVHQPSSKLPSKKQIFATSLMAYVIGNNLGMANFASSAVRLRVYRAMGLPSSHVAHLIVTIMLGNWIGFLLMTGTTLLIFPIESLSSHLPLKTIGLVSLVAVTIYGVFSSTFAKRYPALPGGRRFLAVIAVGCLDFGLSGSVLYTLLPDSFPLSYAGFLGIFLSGHLIGTLSQVPGDIGVIESTFLISLPYPALAPALLTSLLVYRMIYFFLPLLLVLIPLLRFELKNRKGQA